MLGIDDSCPIAVREFEKAGIAPPQRLVAIAGRATATTTAAGHAPVPRPARP